MALKKSTVFTICNVLGWVEYSLYGGFVFIISQKFFPMGDDYSATLYAYIIFAIGFISRPFGGMIFGHIADKYGRERSLMYSIWVMIFCTVIIGLLPEYAFSGTWVVVVLMFARFGQGFAIGGEYTGVMVHLVEQSSGNRRGVNGSWADFGCLIGTFLGGQLIVAVLQYVMDKASYESFGWRIPFVISIFIGIFCLYIKKNMPSKLSFVEKEDDKNYMPVMEIIKNHKMTCLYVGMSSAFSGINFYTILVFIPNYLVTKGILTSVESFTRTGIINLLMLPTVLLSGYLSDKITRKGVIIPGIIVIMLVVYPMMYYVDKNFSFVLQLICGLALAFYFGGRSAFFSEAFPKQLRCSAVSISLSISHAIFAGTTPALATYIANKYGNLSYFAIYTIFVSCAVLYGFSKIKDRTGEELQ